MSLMTHYYCNKIPIFYSSYEMTMDVDGIQNCCFEMSCGICRNRDRCRYLICLLTGWVYGVIYYICVFYHAVVDATTITTITPINPLYHSLPHPYTPTHPNPPLPTQPDQTPYLYLSLSISTYKSTYLNKIVYVTSM